jgi:hypothetical protein
MVARFEDKAGQLQGFVLQGEQVGQRNALLDELKS